MPGGAAKLGNIHRRERIVSKNSNLRMLRQAPQRRLEPDDRRRTTIAAQIENRRRRMVRIAHRRFLSGADAKEKARNEVAGLSAL